VVRRKGQTLETTLTDGMGTKEGKQLYGDHVSLSFFWWGGGGGWDVLLPASLVKFVGRRDATVWFTASYF